MTAGDRLRAFAAPAARSVLTAAVLVLPIAWSVALATVSASRVMFGRDQGIFQYVAWAISHGLRDNIDVCDVNGPLTHAIHQLLLALGGGDELRFRLLDQVLTGISFACAGGCLPGIARGEGAPDPRWQERLAWAAAAWAVLSVQYLSYSYWDIGQRDGFSNWFLLPSLGLQLLALGNVTLTSRFRAARFVVTGASGALSALTWFIKPTCVLTSFVQLLVLLLASRAQERRANVGGFVAGIALGVSLMLGWLLRFSSIPAFFRVFLWDGPHMYGPIWHLTPRELFSRGGFPHYQMLALLMGVVVGVLVSQGLLARRALLLALVPIAALLQIFAQGKGFAYHYHALTAGSYLAVLAVLCGLAERPVASNASRLAAVGITLGVVALLALQLTASPYLGGRSKILEGRSYDRPRYELGEHFLYMRFHPWDLGQAARYVERATPSTSRIFLYGTSPYLLFLSKRLAATSEIYAFQLNVDAALDGRGPSRIVVPGTRLSPAWSAEAVSLRDRYAAEMFARLRRTAPAALVFTDGEPFLSSPNAWLDFRAHNPEAAEWLAARYHEQVRFGNAHVWMPNARAQ